MQEKITRKEMKRLRAPLLVIYDSPADYPGTYVARLWDLDKPTSVAVSAPTYKELCKKMETDDMYRLPRSPGDDPCIVEVWI